MALQDETTWFEANRAYIAQQYNGQYVVVKDKSVRGAYPSYQAAYVAAAQQFGTDFLIEQALAQPKVNRI